MRLRGVMILRAGITWGVVAILLAIIGSVFAPILPVMAGLTLTTFAFIMAGVHYAANLLLLLRHVPLNLPLPGGSMMDLIGTLLVGLLASAAGGLAFNAVVR